MKIIISSTLLNNNMTGILDAEPEMVVATRGKITFVGTDVFDIDCESTERGSVFYNVDQWDNLFKFLPKLGEQPIVINFGIDKLSITGFGLDF